MSYHPRMNLLSRQIGPFKHRLILGLLIAWALPMASPEALGNGPVTPPTVVRQALGDVFLAGTGQMRFWGMSIYDARLWVDARFDVQTFDAHPFALELTYHRAFTSAAIAERSLDEIQRQRPVSSEQRERWLQALAAVLPDVQAGDQITGVYLPGQGMRLWRGNQPLGSIRDVELARLFFGIWLSPRTSEPGLRSALLANRVQAAP